MNDEAKYQHMVAVENELAEIRTLFSELVLLHRPLVSAPSAGEAQGEHRYTFISTGFARHEVTGPVPEHCLVADESWLLDLFRELLAHRDHANGDYWCWQGDGWDFPDSLVCPVLMSAEALRGLLQKAEAQGDGLADLIGAKRGDDGQWQLPFYSIISTGETVAEILPVDEWLERRREAARKLAQGDGREAWRPPTAYAVENAIGGSYQLPDGREFWLDGQAAKEIAARVCRLFAARGKGDG